MTEYYQFPQDFIWGCSTSAYQVEGAANLDGKGKSIWDTFTHEPGNIAENHNADIGIDQYHRYKDDIALMKWLGTKAYRFSVAWSRVFPNGYGEPNSKGMDYYDRLIDELLANGVEPFLTFYHWDLPQALQDEVGGWESKETSEHMANYVAYVTQHVSDRVTNFFTINEFGGCVDLGYGEGIYAPGLQLPMKRVNQARHNVILAHGLAAQAIRANAKRDVRIGVTEDPVLPVPIMDTPEHREAALKAIRDMNAHFTTAVLEGKYMDSYLEREGENAPQFTDEEMKIIGTPIDFFGITMYRPTYCRASDDPKGYEMLDYAKGHPLYDMDWIYFGPEVGYWAPWLMANAWDIKELYVTENGCACQDEMTKKGEILDTDRLTYLRNHHAAMHRAVSEGVPLKGYFVWSLLDNFEWELGFTKRFGIFYVNHETKERTPKMSAHYYRNVIARNAAL